MRLLLDTHALLWFVEDNTRLSARARRRIEAEQGRVLVSAVSLWEIAIKSSLGKLTMKVPFDELVTEQLQRNAMEILPIAPPHLTRLHALPFHHHDPFDRMLAAQALAELMTLVSCDTAFDAYGVTRLW